MPQMIELDLWGYCHDCDRWFAVVAVDGHAAAAACPSCGLPARLLENRAAPGTPQMPKPHSRSPSDNSRSPSDKEHLHGDLYLG